MSGGLDPQLGNQPIAFPNLCRRTQQPPATKARQPGQGQVFHDRKQWCNPVAAAFFGHQRDTFAHRIAGRLEARKASLQMHAALLGLHQTKQSLEQFLGTRTHQPGQPQHFTFAQAQVDIAIRQTSTEPLQFEHHLTRRYHGLGVHLADLAIDHQPGNLCRRSTARIHHGHGTTIAQHGDPVAQALDFLQIMGDVHNRQTLIAQTADNGQQLVNLALDQ